MTALLLLVLAAPNPYLEQAKVFFDEAEYHRCLDRLKQSPEAPATPRETAEIELYRALCQYELGQTRAGNEALELALRLDPSLTLPPLTSPKIRAHYDALKPATRAPEAQEPEKRVEPAPVRVAPPVAVAPPPAEAPAAATTRGPLVGALWASALLTAASTATGITFGYQADRVAGLTNAAAFTQDADALAGLSRRQATIANVAWVAAALFAVATVACWVAWW